jgi:hypothetical protein
MIPGQAGRSLTMDLPFDISAAPSRLVLDPAVINSDDTLLTSRSKRVAHLLLRFRAASAVD